MSTRGWKTFWRRGLNRFDLILTLLALLTFVLTFSSAKLSNRYLVVVLLIQLARMMRHVTAWNLLMEVNMHCLVCADNGVRIDMQVISTGQRPAMKLFSVLLTIMFLFGSIGIQVTQHPR